MRFNTANRSFFTLVAVAIVPYLLLGLFGCGVIGLVAYRLATEGPSGLQGGGRDLRPAAVFFAVVAAGTILAGLSVRRQVRATSRLAAVVAEQSVLPSRRVEDAADRAGLAGRLGVVEDERAFSFTYGLFAPRVAVSRGLVEAASTEELAAVLHHEGYHVRSGDTAKVVVARAAASAFFFLPALGHLRDRYLAGRELAADRDAVRSSGTEALAGALLKAVSGSDWAELGAAAALGGSVFLEQRVGQLEDGREPPLPAVPRAAVGLTAAGLLGLVSGFVWSVAAGGPRVMSMDGSMPGGAGGAALAVLGSLACTAGMALLVVMAIRGARHRPARTHAARIDY